MRSAQVKRAVALRQTDTRYSNSVLRFIPYLVASKLIATAPNLFAREYNNFLLFYNDEIKGKEV